MSDGKYTHIMDALEIIHAENIALMRMLLTTHGVDEKKLDLVEESWDKRFQEVRSRW